MKRIPLITAAALFALSASASATTLEIEVNGLVCAFCAQGIEKSLRAFPATDDVFVSLEHRLVAVGLKEGQTIDDAALRKAITDAGYTTVGIQTTDTMIETLRHDIHNRPHDDD
jgi:copper chaperone CopZ